MRADGKISRMAPGPSDPRDSVAGPLAGLRWSLESPEDHFARHDREQLRYWLSKSPAERLAQAEQYRIRVYGEGPYELKPVFQWLPSVVTSQSVE